MGLGSPLSSYVTLSFKRSESLTNLEHNRRKNMSNQENIYIAPCIVAFEKGFISNEVARDRLVEWLEQDLFWNIYCRGSDNPKPKGLKYNES